MLAILQDIAEFLRQAWVLWLMLIFLALVTRAFWPSRKAKLEEYGHIPLNDENVGGR